MRLLRQFIAICGQFIVPDSLELINQLLRKQGGRMSAALGNTNFQAFKAF